ncbi:hypothetical protein FKG94_03290 [Exilibacterium tricleocarpae]|uniref:Restriction alleviation protein, Lar family n=1 Tax=Exilibacterium tricleocarpae TaxID=2591008 RepID=A0A545U6X7_9GAMM|nr:hypothetical protein [Exilibacterium tricleocarpae]TQV85228.1 hypothetical protein FKG94_03290 [Exilibacterium tricleocarpae]
MKHEQMHCPFCGGTNLLTNIWDVDDQEVDALECDTCKAGAPMAAWMRHNATTLGNTWIDGSVPTQPGQQVVRYYLANDGSAIGPIISTPVRADGTTTYNGKPIYKPTVWWLALPPLPQTAED